MKFTARTGAFASALALATVAVPVPAFAEGGFEILIPKPAEFVPALIAFLIIWFVLAKFVWPKVLGMMDERAARIKNDLDSAAQTKVAAEEERTHAEAIVSDARRQASDIILEARRDAESERARILANAQDEASGIIEKAHANTVAEREAMLQAASESIANLSVQVASKIIGESLDAEAQLKLAEKYVEEAGNLNAN